MTSHASTSGSAISGSQGGAPTATPQRMQRIAIAADHAGVEMKQQLAQLLQRRGHEVNDLGPHSTDSVDYPDFAHALAKLVAAGTVDGGVLVCGTGIGMAMAANRHPGVRAVVCTDELSARLSRGHNNANVLCVGARLVGSATAAALLEAFLDTPFDDDRHTGRVAKIEC